MSQLEDQDAISFRLAAFLGRCNHVGSRYQYSDSRHAYYAVEFRNVSGSPARIRHRARREQAFRSSAPDRIIEHDCMDGSDWEDDRRKPNMLASNISGEFFCLRDERNSNVMSMKVTRASATIPNMVIPIWTGQETTTDRVNITQGMLNHAKRPSRLLSLGHRLPKTIVISAPNGSDAQSHAGLTQIRISKKLIQPGIRTFFRRIRSENARD